MWCSHCRCEVTAEPSARAGEMCCATCLGAVPDAVQSPPSSAVTDVNTELAARCSPHFDDDPRRLLDDAELADDLRRARRVLRIDQGHRAHEPVGLAALLAGQKTSQRRAKRGRKSRQAGRQRTGNSLAARLWGGLTWLVVCAGGMGLTFGAGLLACTQFLHEDLFRDGLARREDLWNWGLLTALAGQFLLFLGFAFRWSSGRASPTADNISRRAKPTRAAVPSPPHAPSSVAPLWSARCEAVLGLSLDSLDRE
jgi:hypothetical protein